MTIDHFTKQDFEAYLKSNHSPFTSLGLIQNEETYSIALDDQVSVTIRSSVDSSGLSADVGSDSIRVWLMSAGKPLGSKISKTTRQPGWQRRLNEKIKQLLLWRALAGDCPVCDKAKGIFTVKKDNENKNRPFAKCQQHNGFVWLDESIKITDIYFSKESGKSDYYRDTCISSQLGVVAQDEEKPKSDALQCANTNVINNNSEQPNIETMSKVQPNEAQLQAIEANIDANVRVLAGPGSGKTFVIQHRYNYLIEAGIKPENILVCTFSKEMANEMCKRIQSKRPEAISDQISTIHAFCYRILTRWYPDSPYYRWKVPKDWQVKKIIDELVATIWKGDEKPNANEVLKYINASKYRGLDTEQSYDYFVSVSGSNYGGWLYEIRSRFDAWLNRNQFMTFTDMLFLMERLLNNSDWRTRLQNRFSHVIVDEAQDTNYQALRILIAINNVSFFCVGDPDQLLYRFQGSEPEFLTDRLDDWLESNLETVKLGVNYRSQDEIIAASQNIIANNYSDLGGPYPQDFMKLYSGVRGNGEALQFSMYESATEEAQRATDQINELINSGYGSGDFFIGARTRAQLGYLEGTLVRAKIPFINICGGSFWQSRHVADVIAYLRLAYDTNDKQALEQIYNVPSANHVYTWNDAKCKECSGAGCSICNGLGYNEKTSRFQIGDYCPTRYLGKEFLAKINYNFNNIDDLLSGRGGWRYKTKQKDYNFYGPSKAQDLQEFVWLLQDALREAKSVDQIIRVIIEDCYEKYLKNNGIDDDGLADAKLEDLATVEDLAFQYSDVGKFLAYVDEMVRVAEDAKNKEWDEYLILSTYHRLKGLERPIVFGLGWCEGVNTKTKRPVGLLPHSFALDEPPQFGVLPSNQMSPIADERCIAFVCISRAIERVYLSGIKTYRSYEMWPSRFISEIGLEK